MIRRPPRSTLFPTRRSSDLIHDGKKPSSWTLSRDPSLLETSVPGIFVVGDVRHGSVKRVASGVGDRKSTRLNSSHSQLSHAAFCLKNKCGRARHIPRQPDHH